MTHMRHVRSIQHTTGQLTHTRSSDGAPELNGDLQKVARDQIRQYRQIYLDKPDPIAFIPVAVDTSGRLYDDFDRLLFLHVPREASALANELPEGSDQFRFLRVTCLAILKGSVETSSSPFSSFPCSLSSMFCLSGTCWVFTLELYWLLYSS